MLRKHSRPESRARAASLLLTLTTFVLVQDAWSVQPVGGTVNLPAMRITALPTPPLNLITAEPACALSPHLLAGCTGHQPCGPASVACGPVKGGLDIVAAGVGLRGTHAGEITIEGVPSGSQLLAAIAYWSFISRPPKDQSSLEGWLDGQSFRGAVIDKIPDLCWDRTSPETTRAFAVSADVTPLIHDEINGTYLVSIAGSAEINGQDPWTSMPPPNGQLEAGNMLEGLSLVLIYAHPSVTADSAVFLHHGPHRLERELILAHVLSPPLAVEPTEVRHLVIAADGQRARNGALLAPQNLAIAAAGEPWTPLAGEPQAIHPSPIFDGAEGASRQLWDTHDLAGQPERPLFPAGTSLYVTLYDEPPGTFEQADCVAIVADALVAHREVSSPPLD